MWNKLKLIVTAKAQKDVDNVYEHYESIREGLGEQFENELDEHLELLRGFPEMCAKFDEEVRKGNMKKFPYSFYYQEDMP